MNLEDLEGEKLFNFARFNKADLVANKLACVTASVPLEIALLNVPSQPSILTDRTTLDVKIVCSTSWLCNSHMDVYTDTCYDESIAKRGNTIPHILDHRHEVTAHVGDVTKIYTQAMSASDLGYAGTGTVTALIMESTVRKDYNEDVFKFYANGKINQHSIGFTYDDISLAMNSSHEDDKNAKAIWDANYPNVINKDVVDKRGYFWLVSKVDVLENSCVLFGSNKLTPTLSVAAMRDPLFLGTADAMAQGNENYGSAGLNLPKQDSSLGIKEETILTSPIGNTMTLEDAQGKIISLTEELATAKSAITVAKLEATVAEKNRGLNILKAQATFGSDAKLQKAALTFIEKGLDVDTAITSFEVIKEAIQGANHVDISGAALAAAQDKSAETKALSPKEQMMAIASKAADKPNFGDLL